MVFQKGKSGNPDGKKAGTVNKTTLEFKEAINRLLDHAQPHIIAWLTKVADTDPARALDLIAKLAEYAHPKLSRSEVKVDASHTHRSEPVSELDRLLAGVGPAGQTREDEKPLPH